MIRNVLVCLITSENIKYMFNIVKKVCRFDRAQINSKTVKEFIILKHYNPKTNRTKNNTFIKS